MNLLHVLAGLTAGGAIGYGYHRLVGCRSGACPLTANPRIATLYGAALGFLMTYGGR